MTCRNNHSPDVMHIKVDRNGRVMHICSDCRRKAQSVSNTKPRKPPTPVIDRLLRKREIGADGCWTANVLDNGHGYRTIADSSGKKHYVHRLAYEHFRGPIPSGMEIDHLCRNRACFNPEHLEPVTRAENGRRAREANGLPEKCRRGLHSDWYYPKSRPRQCRVCMFAAPSRHSKKKKRPITENLNQQP